MTTLTLPSLVAGRELADTFVDKLGDIDGKQVVVDAQSLISGTSSFAGQLVRRIVVDERADQMLLIGAPPSFAEYARDAATRLGVSKRLETRDLAEAS